MRVKFSSLPLLDTSVELDFESTMNMSMITAECFSCKEKFKNALFPKEQHHDDVYIDDDGIVPVFKDSTGNEVELPQARWVPRASRI